MISSNIYHEGDVDEWSAGFVKPHMGGNADRPHCGCIAPSNSDGWVILPGIGDWVSGSGHVK